jgi:hypothetical protein
MSAFHDTTRLVGVCAIFKQFLVEFFLLQVFALAPVTQTVGSFLTKTGNTKNNKRQQILEFKLSKSQGYMVLPTRHG